MNLNILKKNCHWIPINFFPAQQFQFLNNSTADGDDKSQISENFCRDFFQNPFIKSSFYHFNELEKFYLDQKARQLGVLPNCLPHNFLKSEGKIFYFHDRCYPLYSTFHDHLRELLRSPFAFIQESLNPSTFELANFRGIELDMWFSQISRQGALWLRENHLDFTGQLESDQSLSFSYLFESFFRIIKDQCQTHWHRQVMSFWDQLASFCYLNQDNSEVRALKQYFTMGSSMFQDPLDRESQKNSWGTWAWWIYDLLSPHYYLDENYFRGLNRCGLTLKSITHQNEGHASFNKMIESSHKAAVDDHFLLKREFSLRICLKNLNGEDQSLFNDLLKSGEKNHLIYDFCLPSFVGLKQTVFRLVIHKDLHSLSLFSCAEYHPRLSLETLVFQISYLKEKFPLLPFHLFLENQNLLECFKWENFWYWPESDSYNEKNQTCFLIPYSLYKIKNPQKIQINRRYPFYYHQLNFFS